MKKKIEFTRVEQEELVQGHLYYVDGFFGILKTEPCFIHEGFTAYLEFGEVSMKVDIELDKFYVPVITGRRVFTPEYMNIVYDYQENEILSSDTTH